MEKFYANLSRSNQEKGFKDLFTRVTDEAKKLLNEMPNVSPEIREQAFALMKNPDFRKRIENGWKQDTLRGIVDSDPEKQDKLWAKGLVFRIKEELPLFNEK